MAVRPTTPAGGVVVTKTKEVLSKQAATAGLAQKHKGVIRDFYYPRRVHIPWRIWQAIIGACSHAAWIELLMEGVERVRGRFPFDTIRARRSEIMKTVASELLIAIATLGKFPPAVVVVKPVPKLVTIEVAPPVRAPVRR